MREDVGAVGAVVAVGTVGTGLDLAASEIVQECCQGVETKGHCVRGREEDRIKRGEVIKGFKKCVGILFLKCFLASLLMGIAGRGEPGANL